MRLESRHGRPLPLAALLPFSWIPCVCAMSQSLSQHHRDHASIAVKKTHWRADGRDLKMQDLAQAILQLQQESAEMLAWEASQAASHVLPMHLRSWALQAIAPRVLLRALRSTSMVSVCPKNRCHRNMTFHVSGGDLFTKIESEIIEKRVWEGYGINHLPPKATVIDLGGNIGIISVAATYLNPHKCIRVFTIEPNPEAFLFHRWNLYENGVPELPIDAPLGSCGVTPINKALTADGRNVSFVVGIRSMNAHIKDHFGREGTWNKNDILGSKDDPDRIRHEAAEAAAALRDAASLNVKKAYQPFQNIVLPSLTFSSLLASANLLAPSSPAVDVLKIDCEGCEYELMGELMAMQDAPSRFTRISGELHQCSTADRGIRTKCASFFSFVNSSWPKDRRSISASGLQLSGGASTS